MTNQTIGIIGAMQPEIDILKKDMSIKDTTKIAGIEYYSGELYGKNVVLVESGIGKVNASIVTTLLIQQFNATLVINTGVAGSLSNKLDITDIVVGNSMVHHDVDATNFGYDYGQVPGMPLHYEADKNAVSIAVKALEEYGDVNFHKGLIVSGDSFVDDDKRKSFILSEFSDALAVDMESAPIAQVCHRLEVPCLIMRSMSDKADNSADMNYEEFLLKACIHSSNTVKLVLRKL